MWLVASCMWSLFEQNQKSFLYSNGHMTNFSYQYNTDNHFLCRPLLRTSTRMILMYPASALSCICLLLHLTSTASDRSCIRLVLHLTFPASYLYSICPVLHLSFTASDRSGICLVLHLTCPTSEHPASVQPLHLLINQQIMHNSE